MSLVYHKSTFGRDIYKASLPNENIFERVESIYKPFHNVLSTEITRVRELTNRAILIDLHSFGFPNNADVVLGTCHGKSCSAGFLSLIQDAFTEEGFTTKWILLASQEGFNSFLKLYL